MLEEFGPGEVIFREGDQGRHVYVIKSGTVEVLVKRPDGSQEVIRRLGSGDHFGEMALLRKAPRSATVRTVTPVQVFKMAPATSWPSIPACQDSGTISRKSCSPAFGSSSFASSAAKRLGPHVPSQKRSL